MKLGNDLLEKKFDDIDGKIDVLIERCRSFEEENQQLKQKITQLENQLESAGSIEKKYSEQEIVIQSKIDGLLEKLMQFSNS